MSTSSSASAAGFDQLRWQAMRNIPEVERNRGEMAAALLTGDRLVGQPLERVIAVLGPPDSQTPGGVLRYGLGPGEFGPDLEYLVLEIEDRRVRRAYLSRG